MCFCRLQDAVLQTFPHTRESLPTRLLLITLLLCMLLLLQPTQVFTHFGYQLQQPPLKFANSTRTTFSCVDSRGNTDLLGTPGGDLAGGQAQAGLVALVLHSIPMVGGLISSMTGSQAPGVVRRNA